MYAKHYTEIEKEKTSHEGVYIRRLIDKKAGAKNYVMRMFELEPGAEIPKHSHPREHEIYVLEGEGIIGAGDEEVLVKPGYVLFIPENIPHRYKNTGSTVRKFLCIIPCKGAPDRCA